MTLAADLQDSYLNGGAKDKVAKWVDDNCEEKWAGVKGYMETKDRATAKAGLQKRKGPTSGRDAGARAA